MQRTSAAVIALFLGSAHAASFAEGLRGDEQLGQTITMKGEETFTHHQLAQKQPAQEEAPAQASFVQDEGEEQVKEAKESPTTIPKDLSAPEKVHVLDPKIARYETTFYT